MTTTDNTEYMSLKEIRKTQLKALLFNPAVGTVKFVVEELNDSFLPVQTWEFDTQQGAEDQYNALAKYKAPAFLRKYAKVPM